MSKLPRELEHPLDNFLVDLSDAALPVWRALRMVPNHVTLLSIASELAALWFLYKGQPLPFAGFAVLGVYFDYADGYYARTDDMVTRLGDLLDHISDWTYAVAACVLVAWRMRGRAELPLAVMAVLGVAMAVHLGCQQRTYPGPREPETLDALQCMCPGKDPAATLKLTRWVGSVAVFHSALIIAGLLSM